MLVGARVDADDPQLAEVTLFVLAIAISVLPTSLDVLLGCFPKLAPGAEAATSGLHHLLLALQARDVRSDSWHCLFPLCLQQALDVLRFAWCLNCRALTETTLSLRRLFGKNVALERFHAFDFPRAGDFETLSRTLVRLHLRHFEFLYVYPCLKTRV